MKKIMILIAVLTMGVGCKEKNDAVENTKDPAPAVEAAPDPGMAPQSHSVTFVIDRAVKRACTMNDYNAVHKAHEITKEEFYYYAYAFWPTKTIGKKTFGKDVFLTLANAEKCDDYLRFAPTDAVTASDIAYTRVDHDAFEPDTSCHAISLFKGIFEKYGDKINESTLFTFTKGLKIITMTDGTRKIKTTVIFYIKFTDETFAYFDIADDPTNRVM